MLKVKTFSQTELDIPFLSNSIPEIKDLLSEMDKCDELGISNLNESNNSHVFSNFEYN